MTRQEQERLIATYGEDVARSIHDDEVEQAREATLSPWVASRASGDYVAKVEAEPTLGDYVAADKRLDPEHPFADATGLPMCSDLCRCT